MKVGYRANAYATLEEAFGIDIGFTKEQNGALQDGEAIVLTPLQLDHVTDYLAASSFLRNYANNLSLLSMSLFVVNDALWKMMEKKLWDPDKMLAMTTFPICSWNPREEKTSNPKGVKRGEERPVELTFTEEPRFTLTITGEGGDFGGFIEQSHLTARKWGVPESRRFIPTYTFCKATIDAVLDRALVEIHPQPRDMFDYDFSESAKVYHEHGALLSLSGEDVILTIEGRKPAKLKGEVYLLFGTRVDHDTDAYRGLLTDLWLWSLARRIG